MLAPEALLNARRTALSLVIAVSGTTWLISCAGVSASLTQLIEARRLASELRVQFSNAVETGNRAVMASADDSASAAANESRQATEAVAIRLASLKAILESLDYEEELHLLEAFVSSFQEYRRIDDALLPLAVENTNVKAQALSFGAAEMPPMTSRVHSKEPPPTQRQPAGVASSR